MKTISIVNRKGGTGKTTTAHALGAGLIRQGYKVLFIDLDQQCNLTTVICGTVPPGATTYDILTGAKIGDAIHTTAGGVNIIPGSPLLATADKLEAQAAQLIREQIKAMRRHYDYTVIDTPVNMGLCTTAALIATDGVIITAQANLFSVQGIAAIMQQIEAIKDKANKKLTVDGVLLTLYDRRRSFTRSAHDDIQQLCNDTFKIRLYNSVIRQNVAIEEAAAAGLDIFTYSPRSNGAKDYTEFIKEYLNTTQTPYKHYTRTT